jgi:hypothetical protein
MLIAPPCPNCLRTGCTSMHYSIAHLTTYLSKLRQSLKPVIPFDEFDNTASVFCACEDLADPTQ